MNPLLFELQKADLELARLKRERGKLDDGTQLRGERDTLEKALDEERTRLATLSADRTDKELQLKTTEEKIARQQSRLMTAKTSHEVSALERDLKGLSAFRGDLDEAVLTAMDAAETSEGRVQQLIQELGETSAHLMETEAHFTEETARLESEMSEWRKSRELIAAQLDADSLEKYTAFAARHEGIAVTHMERGNCSGCGNTLTPFNLREANSQEWPTCENCGRLLFVE